MLYAWTVEGNLAHLSPLKVHHTPIIVQCVLFIEMIFV